MEKHRWQEKEAKSARKKYHLNKKRELKPESERKSVVRKYKKFRCPMSICERAFQSRIHNHLKDTHGLSGQEYRRQLQAAKILTEDSTLRFVFIVFFMSFFFNANFHKKNWFLLCFADNFLTF